MIYEQLAEYIKSLVAKECCHFFYKQLAEYITSLLILQVSCIEHLCDSLCYQLDLASFVACVNSGQSWNSKSSLLLSGRETMAIGEEDNQFDPFVENFVLERLSVQSSLRVSIYHIVTSCTFEAVGIVSFLTEFHLYIYFFC